MGTKQCFKCLAVKSLDDFYRHKQMPDGHLNKCKECAKRDVRENRSAKVDYYRAYDAKRFQEDPRVRERHLRYQKTTAGKASLKRSNEKYKSEHSNKRAAHVILGNAVRDGRIFKPRACAECGSSGIRIEGHHEDYSKPLDVAWLCRQCHVDHHKEDSRERP